MQLRRRRRWRRTPDEEATEGGVTCRSNIKRRRSKEQKRLKVFDWELIENFQLFFRKLLGCAILRIKLNHVEWNYLLSAPINVELALTSPFIVVNTIVSEKLLQTSRLVWTWTRRSVASSHDCVTTCRLLTISDHVGDTRFSNQQSSACGLLLCTNVLKIFVVVCLLELICFLSLLR